MTNKATKTRCPMCSKEFEEVHQVVSTSGEPFTAIALDPMAGLTAFGVYSAAKEILCHDGKYTHFRFLDNGEERLVKINKYEPDKLQEAHEYSEAHPQPCNEKGCTEIGRPCYLSPLNLEPDDWYCDKHCHDAGYCSMCGLFNAGFESFDFSENGLCASCNEFLDDEYEANDDDYDEDDWGDDDYPYPY